METKNYPDGNRFGTWRNRYSLGDAAQEPLAACHWESVRKGVWNPGARRTTLLRLL